MMRRFSYLLAALLLLSCAKQVPEEGGYGTLSLAVKVPGLSDTKSAMSEEDLLSNARVNIYYADFSGLVRSYRYDQAPETIYLAAGNYRVDIEAGEMTRESPVNPSTEQKSYAGSKEFTISGDQTTHVIVEAGCCNAVARMIFDETIALRFEDGYSLTLSLTGDALPGKKVYPAASTVFSSSDSGTELLYLIDGLDAPMLNWKFEGVLKMTGKAFSKEGKIASMGIGKRYELTLKYIAKDGLLNGDFDVRLDTSEEMHDDMVVFEPVATGISPSEKYEIWAKRATVHADVDGGEYDDPSEVKFEYTPSGSANWKSVSSEKKDDGVFYATLTGLKPATKYAYRLVIKGVVVGDPVDLTTDAAPNVPNASFEYITDVGDYYEWYNSSASEEDSRTAWWGSGNGSAAMGISGSADMGYVICKPDSGNKVDGSRSACLESTWAVVKFAAGNIFSGYFGGLVGTKGGIVYYGRPFTARPSALKLWLKYETGNINREDGYPSSGAYPKKGQPDWAQVYVALGTWDSKKYGGSKDCPVRINTTDKSTFHDYKTMEGSIAYGNTIL
nr:DUF4493 domain-containing protein [Bacteroidales bacterium]